MLPGEKTPPSAPDLDEADSTAAMQMIKQSPSANWRFRENRVDTLTHTPVWRAASDASPTMSLLTVPLLAIVRHEAWSWLPQRKIITYFPEICREVLDFPLLSRESGFQFANGRFLRLVLVRFLLELPMSFEELV